MAACFLTHQGTLLCFGGNEADFRHVRLDELDDAVLVVADADPGALRSGALAGQPVALRPQSTARSGLPRSIGVGITGTPFTVSLAWHDAYLCAGTTGGNVNYSDQVAAWEEFLPMPMAEVALLRDFRRRGWETGRGRRLGPGSIQLRPEFVLQAGDFTVDLRQHPTLGGEQAVLGGRTVVLVDGWRIETLRRYEPLVVWRHDGSEEADEEIVLGVRSLAALARYDDAIHIETRLDRDEIRDRCGIDDGRLRITRPPDGRCGLLPWNRGLDTDEAARGPILLLANGVTCHGALDPLLRALATTNDVALLPWLWTAEQAASDAARLFASDPAEAPETQACSGAVVGLPDLHRSATINRLVSTISANLASSEAGRDDFEDALLRYVIRRAGGASTGLLSSFAMTTVSTSEDRAEAVKPTLINHRPMPAAIRIDAMRALLDGAAD